MQLVNNHFKSNKLNKERNKMAVAVEAKRRLSNKRRLKKKYKRYGGKKIP